MKWHSLVALLFNLWADSSLSVSGFVPPAPAFSRREQLRSSQVSMTETKVPSTFREAEIQGLQYMQERDYEQALKCEYKLET